MEMNHETFDIGGWTVPDEDVPRAASYCRSLASQARASLADTNGNGDSDPSGGDPSGVAQALTDADLETITVQQCRDAGLVPFGRVVVPDAS
jgi:plasmid stabilization system protein ParE